MIDSIVSPVGTTFALDSSPWLWSFDRLETDIHAIRLVYTGSSNGVGLAFDNFSPLTVEGSEPGTSVPEPTSAIGLLTYSRRCPYGTKRDSSVWETLTAV